eukprot:1993066-Amphidinium_carterae.1
MNEMTGRMMSLEVAATKHSSAAEIFEKFYYLSEDFAMTGEINLPAVVDQIQAEVGHQWECCMSGLGTRLKKFQTESLYRFDLDRGGYDRTFKSSA